MIVFYIDEVGNEPLTPASVAAHPFFVLGAMGIMDTSRVSLCEHLRRIKSRFFRGWENARWEDFELKGRYLNSAIRRLQRGGRALDPCGYQGLSLARCNELVQTLFHAWDKFRPVFYFIAVDKSAHLRKHPVDTYRPSQSRTLSFR